jgi:hypothetical protein
MSCMEHSCHVCGYEWFDNRPGGACPDCESLVVGHHFDEALGEQEPDEDWDDDWEDEDEEDEDPLDDEDEEEDWEEEDSDTSRWRYY